MLALVIIGRLIVMMIDKREQLCKLCRLICNYNNYCNTETLAKEIVLKYQRYILYLLDYSRIKRSGVQFILSKPHIPPKNRIKTLN